MDDDNADLWSIGEVARKTGLTVKLIRHWSDTGVVPPAGRTPAGYRVYDSDAVARLELARTLRDLGLGLAAMRAVLSREHTWTEVAEAHVDALEVQIRALRSQQAVLRSATRRTTTPEELTAMTRRARMSAAERRTLLQDFLTDLLGDLDVPTYRHGLLAATPDLPADPTDEQVDAWIELSELVTNPALRNGMRRMARYAAEHAPGEHDEGTLREAERVTDGWLSRVNAAIDSGLAPDSPAADAVVAAVVAAWIPTQASLPRGPRTDDAHARRVLLEQLEVASDVHVERYWHLLCLVNARPVRPSMAAAGEWLTTALRTNPEPGARAAELGAMYDTGADAWEPTGVLNACREVLAAVTGLVSAVDPGRFDRPTPCADWDVRALLDHLVWENLLWAGLADGAPRTDVAADHLGDHHVEAFRSASEAALAAFERPGMLDQRYGPAPGRRLVEQLVIEMLVHGWDLARATGQPHDLLPGLAASALPVVREIYGGLPRTAAGSFAEPQPLPADACALDRLAAYLGRTVT
ncbi:TIGR03086 family metal-binding protein [Streptomyces sp. NBC_00237]|uniref:TIGR03086 family metal-binding protein n=1 Tax=Streptomyces sp. NBC_00237 TaxID=2975687 RepID=UPI0022562C45|nr:TIGR03086 family metal-binding protein [Streptomyces sp. NBC_00237]MCX5202736.1 TIGR03086 family metal-binding protein [Streptomyces sp. NBC_00237]